MFIIKSGCWESLPLPVFEKRQNLSALLLEDRVCPWSGASSREKKLDARSMLCFVHTRSGDVKLPFPFFSFSAQEKGNYAGNETEREAGKLYGGDGQTHKTRLGGGRLMRLNVLTRLSLSSFSLRGRGQAKIVLYHLSSTPIPGLRSRVLFSGLLSNTSRSNLQR